MKWMIRVPSETDFGGYVVDYNNMLTEPELTDHLNMAKKFETSEEAEKWAKAYLPAYYYEIVGI